MKAHHPRNLSASFKSNSYNPSPSNSTTNQKKERPDPLQAFDLKMSLNLKNKNPPKTKEPKTVTAATSTNKFSFQTKLGPSVKNSKPTLPTGKTINSFNQVVKKHLLVANKEDYDLPDQSEGTTREEELAYVDKRLYESNPRPSSNRTKSTLTSGVKALSIILL